MKKTGTVALVVRITDTEPQLIDTLSDEHEISTFEAAIAQGEPDPLFLIYDLRAHRALEEEEFGDYVEELLTQPFVRAEVAEHGVRWMKSKIKIEEFHRAEGEAAHVIAQFAYRLYLEDRARKDFVLTGPKASVRIRVFEMMEKVRIPDTKAA